jgi:hypothetical protein
VLDAPQIANATGQADKIVAISRQHRTVSYRETDGCYDNESVADGNVTGFPVGSPFGPSGFIVNCPVVSLDVNIGR